MENLKIKVNNKKERILIQELLFELGYKWHLFGKKTNEHDYVQFIYAKTTKLLFHGASANDFIAHPSQEVTIQDLKAMVDEKEFVLPEKWCVKDCQEVTEYSAKRFNHTLSVHSNYLCVDENNNVYLYCEREKALKFYTEITFEQFQKYVLKNKEDLKPKHPKVWAWDEDVKEAFETYLIAELQDMKNGCNYLVVGKNGVTAFENKDFFESHLYLNISQTNPNINPTVEAIANRIKKEFEKHPELDWAMIAAHKIYSSHIKESK